jgi:cellulose synthase operon protein YhjQ
MTDRKTLIEQNETPEDVATLYSWANLHGAKYRDFSASRAETREKSRLRVQDAMEVERIRVSGEVEAQKAAEAKRVALAAEEARQAQSAVPPTRERDAQAAQQFAAQQRAAWQTPQTGRYTAPNLNSAPPVAPYFSQQVPPQTSRPMEEVDLSGSQGYRSGTRPFEPLQRDSDVPFGNPWASSEPPEGFVRPAWLVTDEVDRPSLPPAQTPSQTPSETPEDNWKGSRERLTSRWFALKGVFEGVKTPNESFAAPGTAHVPTLAVFSLAGGVGKTSLVATLGRALSARGERVLIVDTTPYGLLPFFFGARDQRPGVLRTFSPPDVTGDAPIQMLTVDPETLAPESAGQDALTQEILRNAHNAGRVIVDLATASGATTRRVLRMAPTVLVPVIPDMNSVVSVASIDAFFQHNSKTTGRQTLPYYILNQFDGSLPLHLDVREVLREQLGDRLLPFALRRTSAVSEALAEGMTVMDYAPNSPATEDYNHLAEWIKSLAAAASTNYRGVRWSER